MMVPTMLKELIDHAEFSNYDLSSLEVITYGAAPMPLPVIRDAISKLPNTRFINAFGQTETASTITMLPPEDHDLQGSPEEVEKKLRRLSSIGKPLDDVIVRIVDEDGEDMAEGEVGEIVASGSRLMKGYWHREDETKETIRNGWLFTALWIAHWPRCSTSADWADVQITFGRYPGDGPTPSAYCAYINHRETDRK